MSFRISTMTPAFRHRDRSQEFMCVGANPRSIIPMFSSIRQRHEIMRMPTQFATPAAWRAAEPQRGNTGR